MLDFCWTKRSIKNIKKGNFNLPHHSLTITGKHPVVLPGNINRISINKGAQIKYRFIPQRQAITIIFTD